MKKQPVQKAAGNGLLDRRLFLKSSLSFGSIALATSNKPLSAAPKEKLLRPDWMKVPGKEFTSYGQPSEFEANVSRFPSPNRVMRNNGVAWSPIHLLEGTITPNGLHFERHHNGVPQINPDQHELLIHGLVKHPLKFSMDNLLRYPLRSQTCFIECGGNSNAGFNTQPSRAEAGYFHGMISCAEWTGIPLSILLDEAGIDKKAKWIIAEGADAFAMNMSIPIEKAMDDAIVAIYQNGERIRPENGYPLKLVLPGWEGVLNVKWLRRLTATADPVMSRNETSKYTELLPSGKARQFTFEMETKSLITSPSSGMTLKDGPGLYQITGLAWTGSGKIKQVDVSTDGGLSWAQAELQEPILSKALTRFRIPWNWQGNPSILKSRAIDETGYIQPEREQLIANRGRHGFFHYNAIVNWEVETDGNINHIYNRNEEDNNLGLDASWD